MAINVPFILSAAPKIAAALPMTLFLAFGSILMALPLALFLAVVRLNNVPVLSRIATAYVSFIRGVPLIVIIYIAYYAIPYFIEKLTIQLGMPISLQSIPPLAYALTAFAMDASAYLSETIRSSLKAVDPGQLEACETVGMTHWQAMRRVIIPQAAVIALPGMGNLVLGLIKGTSLAFMISVSEIMSTANVLANKGYYFIEAYLIASLIYWAVCFTIERLMQLLEDHLSQFKQGAAE